MWLNSTAQMGLRAVVHLARQAPDVLTPVEAVAEALDLPRNYLSKTLATLRRAGVLHSGRGPTGGFRLARPAADITLADVVAPFARPGNHRCLLGRAECRDDNPCPAHHNWSVVAATVERYLSGTTVADIVSTKP